MPGFLPNFFAEETFFANFRGALTFEGTGNEGALSVDAGTKLAGAATARGAVVSNIFNIVSIFVFIAPICRSRSARLLPPAGGAYDGRAEKSREGNFPLFACASCGAPKHSVQYTGLEPSGRNGTSQRLPHVLQTASYF
jgi:hypothetical protein